MRKAYAFAQALTVAFGLNACGGGNGGGDGFVGTTTTSKVARQEIRSSTQSDSTPIQINDIPFTDADTNETDLPATL